MEALYMAGRWASDVSVPGIEAAPEFWIPGLNWVDYTAGTVQAIFVIVFAVLFVAYPRPRSSGEAPKLNVFISILAALISLANIATLTRILHTEWSDISISYSADSVYFLSNALAWMFFLGPLNLSLSRPAYIVSRIWWVVTFVFFTIATVMKALDMSHGAPLTVLSLLTFVSCPVSLLLLIPSLMKNTEAPTDELRKPLLDHAPEREKVSKYATSGFFSKLYFSWCTPILRLGYERPVTKEDVPLLDEKDRTYHQHRAFVRAFDAQEKNDGSSKNSPVLWALISCYWKDALLTGVLALGRTLAVSFSPVLIYLFISTFATEPKFKYQKHVIVLAITLVTITQSLSQRHWSFRSRAYGAKLQSAIIAAAYQKELRLSSAARQRHASGEIVTYIGVDAYRLGQFTWYLHYTWFMVLQTLISLAIVFITVQWAGFACVVVLVLTVLLQVPISKGLGKAQTNMMTNQDKRLRLTTEVLNSMKIIKLQGWENEFKTMVFGHRSEELSWLSSMNFYRGLSLTLFWLAYAVGLVATFTVYVLLGNTITPAMVFTVIAAFANTQEPVRMLPEILSFVSQSVVSLRRLDAFLQDEELPQDAVDKKTLKGSKTALKITNASFSWDPSSSHETLKDIDVEIKHGEKLAICGTVGCGKSSLIAAILGEIPRTKGSVQVNGKIAYVAQGAWIQTGSIRDNITFGSVFDNAKYKKALHACALEQDLQNFPHGDLTEIGERGLNLSGGQKQRIQLARAVYNDADIYLLDDPFSAVDAHTAATLFHECVMGALRTKTVVLVTHQVEFLPALDCIMVLENGEAQQVGHYEQLSQAGQMFEKLLNAHKESLDTFNDAHEIDSRHPDSANGHSNSFKKKRKSLDSAPIKEEIVEKIDITANQLVEEEGKQIGDAGLRPYKDYFIISGAAGIFILTLVCQAFQVLASVSGGLWMAIQVQNTTINGPLLVGGYAAFAAVGAVFFIARINLHNYVAAKASSSFFSRLMTSLFKAPMAFFDTTPSGRILSRVSTDTSLIDTDIVQAMNLLVAFIFDFPGILIVLGVVMWEALLIVIPVVFIVLQIERYYRATASEMMRLGAMTKAPIVNFSGETVNGAATIRAFDMVERFKQKSLQLIDTDATLNFHTYGIMEWLVIRVETCGITLLCIFGLLLASIPGISSGLAGAGMAYAMTVNVSLVILTQWNCILSTSIVSVERIKQYLHIPAEAPAIVEHSRPPAEWPSRGEVRLLNLQLRYRPTTPLVLKGITCTFEGGHKVGVVGRTGSGKTTLISAFFRLVEPAGGQILIDGIDITKIGLFDLRSKLGIIPQEPTLFRGTIRTNLDPLGKYSDEEIWETLYKCQMGDEIKSMSMQLDSSVTDEGGNWSAGQRQLFCLGRVLLKRTRILVLDEATASIDSATDAVLQRVIRTEFKSCTVITVAHRIPTVIDSDKVLALSDGFLAEYDKPEVLLQNRESLFSKLVAEYWAQRSQKSSEDLSKHS